MDFGEFIKLMQGNNEVDDGDLRRALEMYEVDKGCGCNTPRGLHLMLINCIGDVRSYEDCVDMIQPSL